MLTTDLSVDLRQSLWRTALAAHRAAYAPYSGFRVGAAVLDEQGLIHGGCNVENAAYPEGLCAEASALSAMVLAGGRHVKAVLVLGQGEHWVTPCGGCRQKIREFAQTDVPILIADENGLRADLSLQTLLPHSFGPEHLEQPNSTIAESP